MKHLSPQQKKIIDYLSDGQWHCMANPGFFIKDDRTRLSELRAKGYTFDSRPCDKSLTGCTVKHDSSVYMRRIAAIPPPSNYQIFHAMKQSETEPNRY